MRKEGQRKRKKRRNEETETKEKQEEETPKGQEGGRRKNRGSKTGATLQKKSNKPKQR